MIARPHAIRLDMNQTYFKCERGVSLSCRMDSAAVSVSSNWPANIAHQNAMPMTNTNNNEMGNSRYRIATVQFSTFSGRQTGAAECLRRRYNRAELADTARDDNSIVIAAIHGVTHPAAASGIMNKCHAIEP